MSEKSWKDHQAVHIILVLLVFSCTGLSVARIGGWLGQWLGLEHFSLAYWLMWIVALLPLYNVQCAATRVCLHFREVPVFQGQAAAHAPKDRGMVQKGAIVARPCR
jgi:hypothetical protein